MQNKDWSFEFYTQTKNLRRRLQTECLVVRLDPRLSLSYSEKHYSTSTPALRANIFSNDISSNIGLCKIVEVPLFSVLTKWNRRTLPRARAQVYLSGSFLALTGRPTVRPAYGAKMTYHDHTKIEMCTSIVQYGFLVVRAQYATSTSKMASAPNILCYFILFSTVRRKEGSGFAHSRKSAVVVKVCRNEIRKCLTVSFPRCLRTGIRLKSRVYDVTSLHRSLKSCRSSNFCSIYLNGLAEQILLVSSNLASRKLAPLLFSCFIITVQLQKFSIRITAQAENRLHAV